MTRRPNPLANNEGQCINCDGTGHDPNHDGKLCPVCGGAGNFDEEEEDDEPRSSPYTSTRYADELPEADFYQLGEDDR